MVTVPTYQPDVRLRPANQSDMTVRASADAFGSATGRGLEQVGRGLGQMSDATRAVQALVDDTTARDARNRHMLDADEILYGDNGYANTTGKAAIDRFPDLQQRLGKLRLEHSSKLTPAQQAIFKQLVDADDLNRQRTALMHRGAETKRYTIATHEEGAAALLDEAVRTRRDAAQSTMYFDAALAEADAIGRLQGAPSEAIKRQRGEITDSYLSRVATEMVNESPVAAVDFVQRNLDRMSPEAASKLLTDLARPLGAAAAVDVISTQGAPAVEAVVDRIIGAESGGDASAKNPNSSASGLGQFIDSTWLETLKRYRPDLAAGRTDDQLLALKSDRKLGREMTRRYTEEGAAALRKAGLPVTSSNLYLAHFAGPGGARAVLTADPGRSVVDILGPAVVKANGFLKGMTARDLVLWASAKMNGAPAGTAGEVIAFSAETERVIAGLPAFMQAQVRDVAASHVKERTAQAAAAFKLEQASVVDGLKLRIETGDLSITEAEILGNTMLDDGDKAALVSRYNERFDDLRSAQTNVALFNAGELRIDPYSADGRKAVDGVFDYIAKQGDGERALMALPQLVEQSGVVPQRVFNLIRGALSGQSVPDMVDAMGLAVMISDADRAAFGKRDGGGDIQDAVALYRHNVGDLGMTPEQAAHSIIEGRDPEKRKARAALVDSKPAKTWLDEQSTTSTVAALFPEQSGWFSSPSLGDNPVQEAAILSEHREILEQALYETAGNFDHAKTLAADRFKRRYGVTEFSITGSTTITRLPVETTYRPDADGAHGYIRDQAKAELGKEGITADEVFFLADDLTERDVDAGRPPRYRLFYEDETGTLEEFPHPISFEAAKPADVLAGRRKAAEQRMNENRARIAAGRDRDGNLNRFLDADPLTGEPKRLPSPPQPRPASPAPLPSIDIIAP